MTDDKQRAENALMARLEDWAAGLGDAGMTKQANETRYYPTRTIPPMRAAHARGELLHHVTHWLPRFRYRPNDPSVEQMVRIKRQRLPVWEEIVAEKNQPWSRYVSDADRSTLRTLVDTVTERADRELASEARLRASIEAQRGDRTSRPAH
jgi:hypothetical protein